MNSHVHTLLNIYYTWLIEEIKVSAGNRVKHSYLTRKNQNILYGKQSSPISFQIWKEFNSTNLCLLKWWQAVNNSAQTSPFSYPSPLSFMLRASQQLSCKPQGHRPVIILSLCDGSSDNFAIASMLEGEGSGVSWCQKWRRNCSTCAVYWCHWHMSRTVLWICKSSLLPEPIWRQRY